MGYHFNGKEFSLGEENVVLSKAPQVGKGRTEKDAVEELNADLAEGLFTVRVCRDCKNRLNLNYTF